MDTFYFCQECKEDTCYPETGKLKGIYMPSHNQTKVPIHKALAKLYVKNLINET